MNLKKAVQNGTLRALSSLLKPGTQHAWKWKYTVHYYHTWLKKKHLTDGLIQSLNLLIMDPTTLFRLRNTLNRCA